jgi:protein-disulfide isomerase
MSPTPRSAESARDSRRRLYQLAAIAVSVAVIIAVVLTVLGSPSTSQLAPGKPVPGSGAVLKLLAGIPQQGETLGSPTAPVTLVEFGDLQCPSCAIFAHDALPTIVSRYVRPGRVRLVFRGLHIIGSDSLRAARMAYALGQQNHLWEFAELMYANQGIENSSYVTDRYLTALADAIPQVNVSQALAQRGSSAVTQQIAQAAALAEVLHFHDTPSFLLSRNGEAAHKLAPESLDSSSFTGPLDHLLAQSQPGRARG